jgi:hypothetical protein
MQCMGQALRAYLSTVWALGVLAALGLLYVIWVGLPQVHTRRA